MSSAVKKIDPSTNRNNGGIHCVAIAEDDRAFRETLALYLRKKGFEIIECGDGEELYQVMVADHQRRLSPKVELIITDVQMPHLSGLEILKIANERHWNVPIVVTTALGDIQIESESLRLGATAVFSKPFDFDAVVATIRQLGKLSPENKMKGKTNDLN